MYGNRKVGFAGVLSVFLLNDYVRGNQFRKVVHSKSGKYLLENVLCLFCVKMKQTNGVFQFSERCFNPPAQGVKLFQLRGGKESKGKLVTTVSKEFSAIGKRTTRKGN